MKEKLLKPIRNEAEGEAEVALVILDTFPDYFVPIEMLMPGGGWRGYRSESPFRPHVSPPYHSPSTFIVRAVNRSRCSLMWFWIWINRRK